LIDYGALHSLTVEMHSGMLALAFAGISLTFLCQLMVRSRARLPHHLVDWAMRARGYTDAVGLIGAVGGVLALLISAFTGSQAWDLDDLTNDPITRNKILLTAVITVLWLMVVVVRTKLGRGLWACPGTALLYTIVAAVAMGLTALTGSMGAHITQGGSSIDDLLKLLGIDYTVAWQFDEVVSYIIIASSILLIVLASVFAYRGGLFDRRLNAQTCGERWGIPRIGERYKGKAP
jgi:hypothetical protein